jgi:transcriptional regulator
MLVHPWDAGAPQDGLRLAEALGFGQLVASGRDRVLPVVVPTQFVLAPAPGPDGRTEILLHLARANPIWAAIEENPTVLLAVAGDWAYIPGGWKAIGEEDPAWGVPTTYYAAVQIAGAARVVRDEAGKAEILRRQLAAYEKRGGRELVDPASHGRRLRGILGLRVPAERVVAKFKYGGNVDADHRRQVARALRRRSGPGDAAALGHLERLFPDSQPSAMPAEQGHSGGATPG